MDYDRLCKALQARRFLPEFCPDAAAARETALRIIGQKSVGFGGSVTVRELGIYEAVMARGNEVNWHWHGPKEEKIPIERAALAAEVFVTSSNAVLTDGRIVNIDGTGNRVAGLIFGPPEVIVIVGRNKIVDGGIDEAVARTRRDCCPSNARRLKLDTPCARTNECADCRTRARMCNVLAVLEAPTRVVQKFHVLIVDEVLGR